MNLSFSYNYINSTWNQVGTMLESVANEKPNQIQVEMKLDYTRLNST
jgi:hypothetical protein